MKNTENAKSLRIKDLWAITSRQEIICDNIFFSKVSAQNYMLKNWSSEARKKDSIEVESLAQILIPC